jgi:hypothetical protein
MIGGGKKLTPIPMPYERFEPSTPMLALLKYDKIIPNCEVWILPALVTPHLVLEYRNVP